MAVIVLGCGPAGLAVAWAAQQNDKPVVIYSRARKSPLYGAQYLHAPIPGITGEPAKVEYRLLGTAEGYRQKVYDGSQQDVAVSPATLSPHHEAYDIRAAYDELWDEFSLSIIDWDYGHQELEFLIRQKHRGHLFVNTLPARMMCRQPDRHVFRQQIVWAAGDAPEIGRYAPSLLEMDDMTVVCSGDPKDNWYRISKIFGHTTVEWPNHEPPALGGAMVRKPISTNCTCWEDDVIKMGRYGAWRKGELVSDVYAKMTKMLED